eukprot:scaffold3027_cov31-Tisochrysis_lutea.AAC.6
MLRLPCSRRSNNHHGHKGGGRASHATHTPLENRHVYASLGRSAPLLCDAAGLSNRRLSVRDPADALLTLLVKVHLATVDVTPCVAAGLSRPPLRLALLMDACCGHTGRIVAPAGGIATKLREVVHRHPNSIALQRGEGAKVWEQRLGSTGWHIGLGHLGHRRLRTPRVCTEALGVLVATLLNVVLQGRVPALDDESDRGAEKVEANDPYLVGHHVRSFVSGARPVEEGAERWAPTPERVLQSASWASSRDNAWGTPQKAHEAALSPPSVSSSTCV